MRKQILHIIVKRNRALTIQIQKILFGCGVIWDTNESNIIRMTQDVESGYVRFRVDLENKKMFYKKGFYNFRDSYCLRNGNTLVNSIIYHYDPSKPDAIKSLICNRSIVDYSPRKIIKSI